MNRFLKAACFVLALLTVTLVSMPIRSFHILASDTDLQNVTVVDNTRTRQYSTGARNVGNFLKEQKIKLTDKDQCDYDMRDPIQDGMIITIQRGVNINVIVDGVKEKRTAIKGMTVERLITLLQDEWNTTLLYDGDLDNTLSENERLEFTTWNNVMHTNIEAIPYETQYNETTALRQDVTQIRQEGKDGERQIVTSVIYIGGVEQHREIIDDTIIAEPVACIIDKGIGGQLGTTTDTSSPSFSYIQKMTMNASAYTAGYESTGKNPGDPGYGITRMGLQVQHGIVSVDPRVIPLGTRLYVEGYGYSLAADTGSGIIGNMIDLFYESLADALNFGRRNLTIYILGDE